MEESFINLVEKINRCSIDDIKDKVRTKISKEIEKLRKEDDQFSKRLESEEVYLWQRLLEGLSSNLIYLIQIYYSLDSLKNAIDNFVHLLNRD